MQLCQWQMTPPYVRGDRKGFSAPLSFAALRRRNQYDFHHPMIHSNVDQSEELNLPGFDAFPRAIIPRLRRFVLETMVKTN
jgi:hypothetical protein